MRRLVGGPYLKDNANANANTNAKAYANFAPLLE